MSATSEITGPSTVSRTVIVTGSPPATSITSCRVVIGTCAPSSRYESPSTFCSTRSVTSGPRFVNPHAMASLWPMKTPGRPDIVQPLTS